MLIFGLVVAASFAPACAGDESIRSTRNAAGSQLNQTGRPNAGLTLALVSAGGGAADFKAITLVRVLAGANANALVAKLTNRYGATTVKQFVLTFDFAVADALRLLNHANFSLPKTTGPDPKDGKALAAALYTAGVDASTGKYSAYSMLDRLVSHRLHVVIIKDIEANFGAGAGAMYERILSDVMQDVKLAYAL